MAGGIRIRASRRTPQLTSVTVERPSQLRHLEIEIVLTLQTDSAEQKELSSITYDKGRGTSFGISVASGQLICVTSFQYEATGTKEKEL